MWRKISGWSLISLCWLQLMVVVAQAQGDSWLYPTLLPNNGVLAVTQRALQTTPIVTSTVVVTATALAPSVDLTERWIYVNLTEQSLTAYQGIRPVFTAFVSTGLPQYPTVQGDFQVYVKYEATRMTGGYGADYYDLPNVPHTMYFYGGYGLHGAYWHNNFGVPMSHGCVNLSLPDAEWLFNWASVGTWVVIRE